MSETALRSRPIVRWLVPAAAALAVLGGGAAVAAVTAAVDHSLPTRSASDLLVDLQSARLDGLSGTVVERADLGLPALPGIGGQGSSDLTSLITGTHTLRVWYSGPDKARVALLGTLGETDIIRNGTDVWTWNSKENTATHTKVPATSVDKGPLAMLGGATGATGASPGLPGVSPKQIADLALSALNPTTEVSADSSVTVAGRSAYELRLTPRDLASKIGSVRVAIDATEHLPLRAQVFARGKSEPAIEIGFTQVSFSRPDPEQFTFNPPAGAKVVEKPMDQTTPAKPDPQASKDAAARKDAMAKLGQGSAVVGSGWTTVFVTKAPAELGAAQSQLQPILNALPKVSGAWGSGRLMSTALFSALLTDDGRVLIGAVSPEKLYQAAADPAAKLDK